MRTALIDADIILHRVGYACQQTLWNIYDDLDSEPVRLGCTTVEKNEALKEYEGLGEVTPYAESYIEAEGEPAVLYTLYTLVEGILSEVECDASIFYLTEGKNFRHELATIKPYKAGRKAKPVHYDLINKTLKDIYGATSEEGYEADDLIGIKASELDGQYIIVTNDKDLNQIPGWHYDFTNEEKGFFNVWFDAAQFSLWTQCLTGDSTDNIRGIQGMGAKGAAKVLDNCADPTEAVCKAWKKKYPEDWRAQLDETYRLVRILTSKEERDVGFPFPEWARTEAG